MAIPAPCAQHDIARDDHRCQRLLEGRHLRLQPAVGKAEAQRVGLAETETSERFTGFTGPPFLQSRNRPDRRLRMTCLAIGDGNDQRCMSRRQALLQQAACHQDFIIRVGRHNHQTG